MAATNCSADTLLLTEEEARSKAGKIFSCSCGGGEDVWTAFLCAQQPDTWVHFGLTGGGTEEDPAYVTFKGAFLLCVFVCVCVCVCVSVSVCVLCVCV